MQNELVNKPGWLQTLWNINPSLAEKAENDLLLLDESLEMLEESKTGKTWDEVQEFDKRIDGLILKAKNR